MGSVRQQLFCLLLGAAFFAGGGARAAATDLAVLPRPVDAATATPALTVDVIAFNRGAAPADSGLPAGDTAIAGTLRIGARTWSVTLAPIDSADASVPLAPGRFTARSYRLDAPADAAGLGVLRLDLANAPACEITVPAPRQLVAVPESPDASGEAAATESSAGEITPPRAAVDLFDRTFLERISAYESVYFIYGPDDPAVKFQFSFKYRLTSLSQPTADALPTTLQFGFTQRSLWDFDANSSPFYDTSYMPAVFFEKLAPIPKNPDRWFTWLGFQAGYRHESNGRDGDVSRSLNVLFARGALSLGATRSLQLTLVPEVWTYIADLSDNPLLKDYRGYGRLSLILTHDKGPSLTAAIWAGDDFENPTAQLDLHVPIRNKFLDVGTYLLVQYYNGYGESLLTYTAPTETWRAGLSFVR